MPTVPVEKVIYTTVCVIRSTYCYSSQLKYVFRLEENVSLAVGQNSLTRWGNNNLNFGLARDQVVLSETAANL